MMLITVLRKLRPGRPGTSKTRSQVSDPKLPMPGPCKGMNQQQGECC